MGEHRPYVPLSDKEWVTIVRSLNQCIHFTLAEKIQGALDHPIQPPITAGYLFDLIREHCGIQSIHRPLVSVVAGKTIILFILARDGYQYIITEDNSLYQANRKHAATWHEISPDDLKDTTQEIEEVREDLIQRPSNR